MSTDIPDTSPADGSASGAETSPAPESPFDWVGGEGKVRELVDRFYDLMDLEPKFAALRAMHPTDLAGSRDKLFWFLCGWMGGPQHFVERFGHPRLRARHMPFEIGVAERNQWLLCMDQAMTELGMPQALHDRLNVAFFNTADWMRNKGG